MIYQVFIDRFARGRLASADLQPWGSRPRHTGFMGGDLPGILERLDYVVDLGANVLYLTPIFEAPSNHRYDTANYFAIDPRLGSLEDFRALVHAAHERGIRILLDGVFNHCGETFRPYLDLQERGDRSHYRSWFRTTGQAESESAPIACETWKDAPSMPLLDLGCPAVRDYVYRVAAYWTRQGIDGWRLDAVPHVERREFWEGFGRVVRSINPDTYLLAEIWGDARPWLEGGRFDGSTNYSLRDLLVAFAIERSIRASRFAAKLERLLGHHPAPTAQYMCNLLGSHDTSRVLTLAAGDLERVQLAFLLLFCCPGIPAIYYGDEIGLEGGEDPDNRRAMEWDRHRWSIELRRHIQRLIAVRKAHPALRDGDWQTLLVDDRLDLCVFARNCASGTAIVAVNNGPGPAPLSLDLERWGLPVGASWVDQMTGSSFPAKNGRLRILQLGSGQGALLTPSA